MQMFASLKIESVTGKLRAICKIRGTNSLKCLYRRERGVRAKGLTDCSIRKPITTGWTNLPWCFNKSHAFLTLRTISFLPPDFVASYCSCLSFIVVQLFLICRLEAHYHWGSCIVESFIAICIMCKLEEQHASRTKMGFSVFIRSKSHLGN